MSSGIGRRRRGLHGQSWAFEIRISQGSGQRARRLRRRRPGGSRGNREWRTWRTVESTTAHEVLCACVQLKAAVVVRGSGGQRVRRELTVDVGWRNGELNPLYRYDSIGRYHPHPQRLIARDQEQQANTDRQVRRNLFSTERSSRLPATADLSLPRASAYGRDSESKT